MRVIQEIYVNLQKIIIMEVKYSEELKTAIEEAKKIALANTFKY